ncbi:MAG: lactonase family protein [bacterium]|nr:lactonase family protein [bacterium]
MKLTITLLAIFCLCFWPPASAPAEEATANNKLPFFIGTYTGGASQGIYRSELSLDDGSLAEPSLVAELTNPSFLTIHPSGNVLYAVSEVAESDRQVVAYRIRDDLTLEEIGAAASAGSGPCYVSTDHAGEFLFVANYGSGSIAAFRLKPDGGLGPLTSQHQHQGSSINERRQQSPHAHCILADPTDRFVCAVDLGTDQVVIYELNRESGQLQATGKPFKATPGHGPRHLAFHPDGKHAFVIHELTCMLSLCSWDAEAGRLEELQQISTLPVDMQSGYSTAEVLVHPSGKFVFGSNRGHDSIAGFRFMDNKLSSIGHTPTSGKTPRNFRIDPSGKFLLAENQQSDSIVVFRIDPRTGELTHTGNTASVGSPCCIKFLTR